MKIKLILLNVSFVLLSLSAKAQIPVEILFGHKKSTLDVMFFKYVKKTNGDDPSRFLFFNRNRVTMDYRNTLSSFLPVFGSTNAVSFNHTKLHGFAPVVVAQILNQGIYPKTGVQLYYRKKGFTVFSWAVVELLKNPHIDVFALIRYEPKSIKKWQLYHQIEFLNVLPTESCSNFNFIQRIRTGLKSQAWQFGLGVDLIQTGNKSFVKTNNFGGFLRHEL
jgi:hypothetical protein